MKKQKFTALCIALGLFLSTETLAQNSTDSIKQMSAEELAQSPAFMFLTLIGNLHDKGLLETSGDGDCKTIDMDFNDLFRGLSCHLFNLYSAGRRGDHDRFLLGPIISNGKIDF